MAVVVATLLVVSACGGKKNSGGTSSSSGSGSASGSASGGPSGQPQSGGTIRLIMPSEGQDIDPVHTSVAASAFGDEIWPIFDTLIRVDAKGTITPRIATAVTTSDGGLSWTIKLREGVKFSDGTPYDAAALMYNWQRDQLPTSAQAGDAKNITSMTVTDPTTLDIKLAAVNTGFPYLLQGVLGMNGSPTAIKSMGAKYSTSPIGAGPFIVTNRVAGNNITYKKNPTYWDNPRPYADGLQINFIQDANQASASLTAGEADAMDLLDDSAAKKLQSTSGIRVLSTSEGLNDLVTWFNNIKAPTDDVRIRRALVIASDPEDANSKADSGAGKMITNLFPKDSPYYDAQANVPWNGNVADAQKLVDSYVADHGGQPVTIQWLTTPGSLQWPQAFAQTINSKLKNVHIDVVPTTPTNALAKTYDKSFQMVGGTISNADPVQILSDRFQCKAGRNNANYCNPQMDAALTQAKQATTVSARAAALAKVQEILWQDMPIFPINVQPPYK
ncbi:MAG: ABC transporter substrate-binding protein, partial [Actinobacteria bacterium]|nr:ABC transporter substrate-binding protein [Actinomycetota bacterium]